jgi:FAD/FMN-containing dehydrogenase
LEALAKHLAEVLGDDSRVITQSPIVERLSRDFYWYSPVLRPLLDGKCAEVAVQPVSAEEVVAVLRLCYALDVPVTVRGAGTGNYGQAVPLQGGVVLDLARMAQIEGITSDGVAICQPGVRLGVLESTARESGWELRCYPSTIVKATVGGFLGGGSGGIGSVAHGALRDFNTVRAFEAVTMEAEPRILLHEGEGVHGILHAWGTNGVMTRIWLALTPAVEWAQCAVCFPTFDAAFNFGNAVATNPEWTKRLVTAFEWPIPSFFTPVRNITREGATSVFLLIANAQAECLKGFATDTGGEVTFCAPYVGLRSSPLLSDYTWNHTTLWAMKTDPAWTYLQCGFDPDPSRAREQLQLLKQRFGDDFLHHIEWMKNAAGIVFAGAIPVVCFRTPQYLNEMIDTCRANGVFVANPHVNYVEGGGRYRADNVQLQAKYRYDPKGLLNPGKMATFHRAEEDAVRPSATEESLA